MAQGTFSDPFTLKGIFEDPSQLNQLTQNPMFNIGMGLLQHRADASVNPFAAALGGLQSASEASIEAKERERLEQQRKALQEWLQSQGIQMPGQANVGAQFGQAPGTTSQPFQTPGRYGGGLQNRVLTDTIDDAVVERILGGF